MWRYTSLWDMFNIIKANIVATTSLIVIVNYYVGFEKISRSLFLIDLILTTGIICTSRLGIRMFFSHIMSFLVSKNSDNIKKKILLIGAGDTENDSSSNTSSLGPMQLLDFLTIT